MNLDDLFEEQARKQGEEPDLVLSESRKQALAAEKARLSKLDWEAEPEPEEDDDFIDEDDAWFDGEDMRAY